MDGDGHRYRPLDGRKDSPNIFQILFIFKFEFLHNFT
jgi:hypothetical protein